MSPIPVESHGWDFNPETCPPDQDFIEYLESFPQHLPVTIFHLGPGMHHMVGLWAARQKDVYVRAMSITPPEVVEYIRLATENPELNSKYLVDFGDVHLLDTNLIPRLDYITLFHLGEISSQVSSPEYPGKSVLDVVGTLYRKLSIRGRMLFFENSVAWKDIKRQVEINLLYRYPCERSTFKSLTIFQKTRE